MIRSNSPTWLSGVIEIDRSADGWEHKIAIRLVFERGHIRASLRQEEIQRQIIMENPLGKSTNTATNRVAANPFAFCLHSKWQWETEMFT